jgi:hypothetical protein
MAQNQNWRCKVSDTTGLDPILAFGAADRGTMSVAARLRRIDVAAAYACIEP